MYSHSKNNDPGEITQAINASKTKQQLAEVGKKIEAERRVAELEAKIKAKDAALEFYRDEAAAIAINMAAVKTDAVMASVRVLQLDAGKRATDAMV